MIRQRIKPYKQTEIESILNYNGFDITKRTKKEIIYTDILNRLIVIDRVKEIQPFDFFEIKEKFDLVFPDKRYHMY